MPTIKISDLQPTGSELFADSESYMNELGDSEFEMINGGGTPTIIVSVSVRWTINITARQTPKDPGLAGGLSHAISQISRLIF